MKRRFGGIFCGALALLSLTSCGGGSAGEDNGFVPTNGVVAVRVTSSNAGPFPFVFQSPVTVPSGAKVEWINETGEPHGITWDNQVPNTSPGPPASVSNFNTGVTTAPTTMPVLTTQTTYNYHCTVHGPMMSGQMIVTP